MFGHARRTARVDASGPTCPLPWSFKYQHLVFHENARENRSQVVFSGRMAQRTPMAPISPLRVSRPPSDGHGRTPSAARLRDSPSSLHRHTNTNPTVTRKPRARISCLSPIRRLDLTARAVTQTRLDPPPEGQ